MTEKDWSGFRSSRYLNNASYHNSGESTSMQPTELSDQPFWTNGIATLYHADARAIPLSDKSVHCAITSPPYWGLRDYGLGEWEGGDGKCDHHGTIIQAEGGSDKQRSNPGANNIESNTCRFCGATKVLSGIGLEPTLGEWLENMVAVGREVWRVLRDDGTFWLNCGDAYVSHPGDARNFAETQAGIQRNHKGSHIKSANQQKGTGLPSKNLMGLPWRLAFALQDDGWILRKDIIWHKPNPMPESVQDRPTTAHEYIFLFSKQQRYYYDAEAIRQPHKDPERGMSGKKNGPHQDQSGVRKWNPVTLNYNPTGRNAHSVWTIPTQGYSGAHFATFPEELPRRCILAGTSEKGVCQQCGAPWARLVEKATHHNPKPPAHTKTAIYPRQDSNNDGSSLKPPTVETLGWEPTCQCDAEVQPATVLDPFAGSGTTLAVAQSLGRHGVGTDLNTEYLTLASKRIGAVNLPLPLGM